MIISEKFFDMVIHESNFRVPPWLYSYYLQNCKYAISSDKTLEQNIFQIIVSCIEVDEGICNNLIPLILDIKDIKDTPENRKQGGIFILSSLDNNDIKKRVKQRLKYNKFEKIRISNIEKIYEMKYEKYNPKKYEKQKQKIFEEYKLVKEDIREIINVRSAFRPIIRRSFPNKVRRQIDDYIRGY